MPYTQPQVQNLPDNLYTRGAVAFNTPQYFNYIEQAKARRQAKQEAVDNYYQELGKNLTSSGMAGNDVPDFMDKVNKWREFTIQNRQTLSNPNSPDYAQASTQAGYLYNDAQQHSSISKDKVKQLADARQFIKPNSPLTDASVMMMHNATLPIDKGYQPMDYSLFDYQDKPDKPAGAEDLIKYENFVKNGLQMSEGQPAIIVDPKTKSKVVTTKSYYEPQAINTMAKRAEWLYKSDPKFSKIVDDMSQDPNNYAQLNDAFKKTYGHDLDIKHPEEFATALLLGQTEKTNTQPYNYSPTTIKIDNSAEKAKAKQGWVLDLVDAANSGDVAQINNVANQLFAGNSPSVKLKGTQVQNGNLYFNYQKYQYKKNKDGTDALDANGKPVPEWRDKSVYMPLNQINKPEAMAKLANLQQEVFGSNTQAENTPYYKSQQAKNGQPQTNNGYTNITETNKGTIGVKNGKWYDIKTGKPIE